MGIDQISRLTAQNPPVNAKRSSRAQERLAARAERREQRAAEGTPPAPTKPPEGSAPPPPQSGQAAGAQPPPPPAEGSRSRNFIGSLNGARVVNFAQQGGRDANPISVFQSGEGPKAIQPKKQESKPAAASSSESSDAASANVEKVDVVA